MKRKEKGSESVRFIGFVVSERKNLLKNKRELSEFAFIKICDQIVLKVAKDWRFSTNRLYILCYRRIYTSIHIVGYRICDGKVIFRISEN